MSAMDDPMTTQPPPPERPSLQLAAVGSSKWRRLLRSWRGVTLAGALIGIALAAKVMTSRARQPSCREARSGVDDAFAVLVCQKEYARTRAPHTGALLADSLRRVDNCSEAAKVTAELMETAARADALFVVGKCATDPKAARQAFEQATELHELSGQWGEAAKDLMALAQILNEQQQHRDAINVLNRALHLAAKAGNRRYETSIHRGAAHVLRELGNAAGAMAEIDYIVALDGEHVGTLRAKGDVLQDIGAHHQAAARFEKALGFDSLSTTEARDIHLNLAYSYSEIDRLHEAALHLRLARDLDTTDKRKADRLTIEGLLETKRGDLARADQLFAAAIANRGPEEQGTKADNAMSRAELALRRGALDEAIARAQEASDWIAEVRAKQQLPFYRSWITAHLRHGDELLFLALARAGRAEQALLALDRWQSEEALDRMTPAEPAPTAAGLQDASADVEIMAKRKAALRDGPLARTGALAELRQRMAEEDFLALVITKEEEQAEQELWRLESRRGQLKLSLVGKRGTGSELERLLSSVTADPIAPDRSGDAALLGALLIPSELAVTTDRVLHILLDPQLTELPVEALRFGTAPLIKLRPVVRVLRPSQLRCEEPPGPSPRVGIIVDAVGDLPATRAAGQRLAERFGVESKAGPQAVAAALAGPFDLLHLGVHADVEAAPSWPGLASREELKVDTMTQGGFLQMNDGPVRAVDLAIRGGAPKVVVLATCLSAVAHEGNQSLATAYLAAGAHQVVATLQRVSDEGTAAVTAAFYAHQGQRDPVRALAKAQAELSLTRNHDWWKFAVYGRQVCKMRKTKGA
jgi:predicted negative regulator of RcsB-dependent stress response